MRSSERTIKRLGEIIAGDEAVSEDPGRLNRTYPSSMHASANLTSSRYCQTFLISGT